MFKRFLGAAAGVVFGLVAIAAMAAYQQTLMNDGTNLWQWSSVTNQLVLQDNAGVNALTVDPNAGPIPPITVVASLPTCNTARKGAVSVVTDASSPTYGGALTGSSTTVTLVMCNGTSWVSH